MVFVECWDDTMRWNQLEGHTTVMIAEHSVITRSVLIQYSTTLWQDPFVRVLSKLL